MTGRTPLKSSHGKPYLQTSALIEPAGASYLVPVKVCYYGCTLLYCEKDNLYYARYSYRTLGAYARALFFVH
jgi:hypothetical protein